MHTDILYFSGCMDQVFVGIKAAGQPATLTEARPG